MKKTEVNFDNSNALLRFEDVSDYLNLSRSTIYRLIASGDFPSFFKIGGGSFIRAKTLMKFLDEQEQQALAA